MEAFLEADEESRPFDMLENESTLYKAMQVSFRGSDYPRSDTSNLKITDNEADKVKHMLDAYKMHYIDCLKATLEFESLITYPDGTERITGAGENIKYLTLP